MFRGPSILVLAILFTIPAGCASSNPEEAMTAIARPDYLAEMVVRKYGASEAENYVAFFNYFKKWRKYEDNQTDDTDATDRVVAVSTMLGVLKNHSGEAGSGRALFIEVVSEGDFSGGYGHESYFVVRNTKHNNWTSDIFHGASYDGVLVNAEAWRQTKKLASLIKDNDEGLSKWPQSPLIIHLWDGTRWRSSVHNDPGVVWMTDKGMYPDIHGGDQDHDANRGWAAGDTEDFDVTILFLYLYFISGEDKDALFRSIPNDIASRLMGINEFYFSQMGQEFPGGIEKAMGFLDDYLPQAQTDVFGREIPARKVPGATQNVEPPPSGSEDASE